MSNLVFVSGDFCSGSTLVFTIFRKTGEHYCLYEPLHERLPEYLFWRLPVYEHHFFVDDYLSEYKGFDKVPVLLDPRWGTSDLFLPPEAEADALYRYLSYLIGTAFGRRDKDSRVSSGWWETWPNGRANRAEPQKSSYQAIVGEIQ